MLWEHEPQASVSTVFSSSPASSPARASSVSPSLHGVIQTRFLTNQRAYFPRTVF